MLKQRIEQDLKTALLAGDKTQVTVLRSLKSAVLYVEVAKGAREEGLSDQEILDVLTKESKKRQESADLYIKGGDPARADGELAEKAIIDRYLPQPLSEMELNKLIDAAIQELGEPAPQTMGKIIAKVKQDGGAAADGALVARLVKERL